MTRAHFHVVFIRAEVFILSNYDEDDNDNVKKKPALSSHTSSSNSLPFSISDILCPTLTPHYVREVLQYTYI